MLNSAIVFLTDELNLYLKKRLGTGLVIVEAGGLSTEEGKWAVPAGRLRLALVNIEEERVLRSQIPDYINVNGSQVALPPDIKLNLIFVLAARPGDTESQLEHLLRLSHAITFFQAHPSFSPQQYPGLDPHIDKLTVEMLSYGPEQLNQLWAYIGTKYLPSVVYRARMLVLRDSEPLGIGKPITDIDNRAGGK